MITLTATRASAALVLLMLCTHCGAAKPRLSFQSVADSRAMSVKLQNSASSDISVCVSDDLNLADPPIGEPTPFYLESFAKERWHIVIGSDIAFHAVTFIERGDNLEFTFRKPGTKGIYRIVMLYGKRGNYVTCHDFEKSHPHRVNSTPFVVN